MCDVCNELMWCFKMGWGCVLLCVILNFFPPFALFSLLFSSVVSLLLWYIHIPLYRSIVLNNDVDGMLINCLSSFSLLPSPPSLSLSALSYSVLILVPVRLSSLFSLFPSPQLWTNSNWRLDSFAIGNWTSFGRLFFVLFTTQLDTQSRSTNNTVITSHETVPQLVKPGKRGRKAAPPAANKPKAAPKGN